MLFSSTVFVFLFLPVLLILTFIIPARYRNGLLLFASIFYYAWGGPSYTALLISSILLNYFTGRGIDNKRGSQSAKNILIIGIVLNILLITIFKYTNFIVDNLNFFTAYVHIKPILIKEVYLPLGISFFTFQGISYIVDVYRRKTEAQKNVFALGLFISLFPQLIAGPILKYHDIAPQLFKRTINHELFVSGVKRFIIGLGKKVLIANTLGLPAKQIFDIPSDQMITSVAWLGIICFMLQLYFDFSGYSDMAIGLARMFGFRIKENFNFPYISRSIRELWTRWHISLSTWFKDYLYIPLGGNRVKPWRVYVNLFTVFLLTGFWHGAAWNFILFGLVNGLLMIAERSGFDKVLQKSWRPFSHIYTLFGYMISLVFFNSNSASDAFIYLKSMFGFGAQVDSISFALEYMTKEVSFIGIFAILSCTRIWIILLEYINEFTERKEIAAVIYKSVGIGIYISILLLSMMYISSDAYNPFIYFRF